MSAVGAGRCGPVGRGVPAAGLAGDDGVDLAGVTDADDLGGECAERAHVGIGGLPCLIDHEHVGGEDVGVGVGPPCGGGDEHSPSGVGEANGAAGDDGGGAVAEVGGGVFAGPDQAGGAVERAEAAGDFDGLVAGLGGDADAQVRAGGEGGGEQRDQAGLSGTGWAGHDDGRVAGPRGVQDACGGGVVHDRGGGVTLGTGGRRGRVGRGWGLAGVGVPGRGMVRMG
jgi:hypothetical protein